LKALVIISVVLTHAAVPYSRPGLFHGFLFVGYFIPQSLERKGVRRFMNDRLFRLGFSVLAFMFIIHPVCTALSRPETDILRYWIEGITSLEFLSRSGPLWFARALLIFTLVYIPVRKIFARSTRRRLGNGIPFTVKNALLTVLLITAFAFRESFFCVSANIGLVGIFRERFDAGRPAAKFLSDRAFGVYVFHAPVLIEISTTVKGIALHPILKFCSVSILAVTASFAVSWAIRRVGFLRKVFS
jgi:hypothetical protein